MTYTTHADLGGRDGFGPVVHEREDELFHAEWESRVLALTLAMGATDAWNIDMSRSARETLHDYERLSYYQVWLAGLQKLLAERALVQPDEVAAGRMLHRAQPLASVLRAAEVAATLQRGTPTERPTTASARFHVGQRVRARKARAAHHTRLPGYVRGKTGLIERVYGMHVFADAHAQGQGEQPRWLYTVAFDATQLWGTSAAPGVTVSVDAWEPYLLPA